MKLEGFYATKNGELCQPILDYIASTEELAWEALYLNDPQLPDEGLKFYNKYFFIDLMQAHGYMVVPCALERGEK